MHKSKITLPKKKYFALYTLVWWNSSCDICNFPLSQIMEMFTSWSPGHKCFWRNSASFVCVWVIWWWWLHGNLLMQGFVWLYFATSVSREIVHDLHVSKRMMVTAWKFVIAGIYVIVPGHKCLYRNSALFACFWVTRWWWPPGNWSLKGFVWLHLATGHLHTGPGYIQTIPDGSLK